MIKIEKEEVFGWEAAIRGMRNPMNSWRKTDSYPAVDCDKCGILAHKGICNPREHDCRPFRCYEIGKNDLRLMRNLVKAGPDHGKFLRMINVTCDITAPLYWWKEFDTYKVGTVANSCSTMHKIHEKEFMLEDFSCEHLFGPDDMLKYDERAELAKDNALAAGNVDGNWCYFTPQGYVQMTCNILNHYREKYLETKDKKYWWQMIQLLPTSYNQKRTVQLNYQILLNMYNSRKDHKLDEWKNFCSWIEQLPYFKDICIREE